MTPEIQGTFGNLVATYGYVFAFMTVRLESLGIPLPGETALVTAAALAALGRLNIYGVVAATGRLVHREPPRQPVIGTAAFHRCRRPRRTKAVQGRGG